VTLSSTSVHSVTQAMASTGLRSSVSVVLRADCRIQQFHGGPWLECDPHTYTPIPGPGFTSKRGPLQHPLSALV